MAALIFFGIRGRFALKSPIRWGSAFVSEYNFTNQLGLNPIYTFIHSVIDENDEKNQRLNLINEVEAINNVRNYFGITDTTNYSPVVRKVFADGLPNRYNVVLVLMESMTSYNMNVLGNKENLTPILDSLYNESLSFSNFYSDGIHTFNGLYSSLFGMPSLPDKHHLKDLKHQQPYGGLAKTLFSNGYETIFFTTHDEQFDNMGGFLAPNGFQEIISQKDYSSKQVLNTLGIPDHILFNESIVRINKLHDNRKLFFATILTSSNHGPYEVPEGINFSPRSSDIRKQVVEYSDWSVGEFLKSCSKEKWFDSTVFLFTGDHGLILEDMDMYLTFHRVPLIVFNPKLIKKEVKEDLGGQVDIYPTVMGILNQSYTNNSFGIDLLKEKRKFLSFSYDNEFGTFSTYDFYIQRRENSTLFMMNPEGTRLKQYENKERADSMLDFANSVMQTHQWMIENRRVY
jgi:phosphoglycerol transferase MdoB-like AlkP superfamily enzyme